MDPEIDSTHNPRPAAGGSSQEKAVPEAAEAGETSAKAIDRIADRLMAEDLATKAPEKGANAQSKTYKHPMLIDLLLAIGLLFAMAGLTVSFVKTYITHSAKTSILQGNYKAAIGILHGSPIPEFFGGAGTDNSEDLLNQALYLDAMEKLDNNRDDQTALQELSKVSPSQGSYYYDLAQDQFRKLKLQDHDLVIPGQEGKEGKEVKEGKEGHPIPGAAAVGAAQEKKSEPALDLTGNKPVEKSNDKTLPAEPAPKPVPDVH